MDSVIVGQQAPCPSWRGDLLVKGSFKAQSGQSFFVPISFGLPHVSHQNGAIYLTQTAAATIDGAVHDHEIDT